MAHLVGIEFPIQVAPGTWAESDRACDAGDSAEIRLPMRLRMESVDALHSRRMAVVHGLAVLVMDDWSFEEVPQRPETGELQDWLVRAEERPGVFRIAPERDRQSQARFRPFYMVGGVTPCRMYHDLDPAPICVW